MAILRFLVAIAVLGVIGGIGLIAANTARGRSTRGGILLTVVAGIIALVLIPLNAGLVLVQPDEIGVVFRQTSSGEAALREPLDRGLEEAKRFQSY